MHFREARQVVIDALLSGRFQHEPRADIDVKNLLYAGDVSVAQVISLLQRCRGDQHETGAHHWDASQEIHVFKPTYGGDRWYIKCYVVVIDDVEAVFISVHQ